nr:PREDICTED: uncharacterized protein LOC103278574 [Anolis carolinensis]|eukprot:XP_008107020.1 PREDICTED: uncharacterized protein LOC103278574 [Anolis carolinensis]
MQENEPGIFCMQSMCSAMSYDFLLHISLPVVGFEWNLKAYKPRKTFTVVCQATLDRDMMVTAKIRSTHKPHPMLLSPLCGKTLNLSTGRIKIHNFGSKPAFNLHMENKRADAEVDPNSSPHCTQRGKYLYLYLNSFCIHRFNHSWLENFLPSPKKNLQMANLDFAILYKGHHFTPLYIMRLGHLQILGGPRIKLQQTPRAH